MVHDMECRLQIGLKAEKFWSESQVLTTLFGILDHPKDMRSLFSGHLVSSRGPVEKSWPVYLFGLWGCSGGPLQKEHTQGQLLPLTEGEQGRLSLGSLE